MLFVVCCVVCVCVLCVVCAFVRWFVCLVGWRWLPAFGVEGFGFLVKLSVEGQELKVVLLFLDASLSSCQTLSPPYPMFRVWGLRFRAYCSGLPGDVGFRVAGSAIEGLVH